ncbi:histidine kinase/DNA gyrase B/HSP90-like ATPase [Mucilaginibacter oryzae]|uniref:histidine kinase n=2 Tax=Mucilaginibacter oryzae TaxID=468058 RepID=A0A316HH12_9SPHI|nr:histidine kinase/DNA gyrase B/HSP90-like ATPase [Mucilaginibacter oryzae]
MNQTNEDIKLLLFMGIAVMLSLFASILLIFIFFQRKKYQYHKNIQQLHQTQQNQLIEAAVRSEETERHRIAEELHDEVGAILSAAKLHFQGVTINASDKNNVPRYQKGQELLDGAIKQVRGISHNLHSSILKEFGLNEAIRHFTEKIALHDVIKITTRLDSAYEPQNAENDMSIYRMVQELMNNIIKHAVPKNIRITSKYHNSMLNISIFHDGKGLAHEEYEAFKFNKNGMGLKAIQTRIILLKGELKFSKTDTGYRIDLNIPQ